MFLCVHRSICVAGTEKIQSTAKGDLIIAQVSSIKTVTGEKRKTEKLS